MGIACGLTDDIERSALALCDLADMIQMLFLDEQAHTLLTLIGNDFLRRKCRIADGQLGHIDETATLLNEFAEAVDMSGRAVVVN